MMVSIVKLANTFESLRRALELGGFPELPPGSRILIKPNICLFEWLPPYGMVTTTALLEGLLHFLAERGLRHIAIGEGSVDVFNAGIRRGYRRLGIERLAGRYGVSLYDFNKGPFRQIDLDGVRVGVAEAAFQHDVLINIPALKTHNQVKVSLAFKNLKGLLSPASRVKFHSTNRLDHLIRLLAECVRTDFTVIDGTYALESGPDTALGRAHRTDLVIAGREAWACDVVGSALMGIDPAGVAYLDEYARARGLSLDPGGIEIRGDGDIAAMARKLDWRVHVSAELAEAGISGLSAPHPGNTICSRCYAVLGYSLLALARDNRGADLGGAVVYAGRQSCPDGDGRKVILFGDCAAGTGKGPGNACRITGCPPDIATSLKSLWERLLPRTRIARIAPGRAARLAASAAGFHTDALPKWERYRSADFDPGHFRASGKQAAP